MRQWIVVPLALLASGMGQIAHAQNCASGGGATVCLTANGTADNIQLSWTSSGKITGLQLYRDTDSDPQGRSRIAQSLASPSSYTDTTAAAGTTYWYWLKFNAAGGSYNTTAASATRTACAASWTAPWVQQGTQWTSTSSVLVGAGAPIRLGPQPSSGGTWSWSGCGTSGSAREQAIAPTASCTASATFTTTCGAKSTLNHTITVQPAVGSGSGKFIMVDQFGYLPDLQKVAVVRAPVTGFDSGERYTPGTTFQVIDSVTNAVVHSGSATVWNGGNTDTSSGDKAWLFDFSTVTTPGVYEILDVERNVRSARFRIDANVYKQVLAQAVRTFFYQRAGQAKAAQHVGAGWADGVDHLGPLQDANARRYNATGDASTERDLRGGWYDAGDMNKYTSWTAGYVVDLLHAYTENPSIWTDDFNIPESGNGVPDLIDEVIWGMDWLKRMQNADGSVLSILGIQSISPPSSATGQSLYGDASTSATLASAAAYARAAKVLGSLNNPSLNTYAADLTQRARRAWDWALANPNVLFYNNDSSRGTGGLGAGQQEVNDTGRANLRLVAAIYLYAQTGDAAYRSYVDSHYTEAPMFASWWLSPFNAGVTRPLLYYTSLPNATASVASDIRNRYAQLWERADYGGWGALNPRRDPYGAFITDYTWGSNAPKALAGGMFADQGYYGFGGHSSIEVANAGANYLHYLHGVNPLGKVYLSNMRSFGAMDSVDQFFHAWFVDGSPLWDSVKDSTYGPPPGFLVGGPNPISYNWDDRCPGISPLCGSAPPAPPHGQPAQKAYKDFNTGWPLNSWSVTENSNGYQVAYIRLLARFVK